MFKLPKYGLFFKLDNWSHIWTEAMFELKPYLIKSVFFRKKASLAFSCLHIFWFLFSFQNIYNGVYLLCWFIKSLNSVWIHQFFKIWTGIYLYDRKMVLTELSIGISTITFKGFGVFPKKAFRNVFITLWLLGFFTHQNISFGETWNNERNFTSTSKK